LRAKLPTQLSVVYRSFPLASHSHAVEAAVAAECADRQNNFVAFHELITTVPVTAFGGSWNALAAASGIRDTIAFARCRASLDILARINADKAAGEILGVTATPGILVNDQQYSGLPKDIERVVLRAVEQAEKHRRISAAF
jgi:protein-disulfide isomerase